MPEISDEAFAEAIKRNSPAAFPYLALIEHPKLREPLRLTNEPGGITSNGETYTYFPFTPTLTAQNDRMPRARIIFQNADRTISEAILSITDPAEITLSVVTSADHDKIEREVKNLLLVNINGDAATISGDLMIRNYEVEPYPGLAAAQTRLPGLWR